MDEKIQKAILEWKTQMSDEQCRHSQEIRRINKGLEDVLLSLTSGSVYSGFTKTRFLPVDIASVT